MFSTRGGIAAVALLTGALMLPTSLSPVVAGGADHSPGIVSENAAETTPDIMNGRVNAMLVMNGMVYVGGTFSTVQNPGSSNNITRRYILAYDEATGQVSNSFQPVLNRAVEALAPGPDGQSIYIGGGFSSTNGNTRYKRLVRVDATDGSLDTTFRSNPNRKVLDLVQNNGNLYASGEFTKVRGELRSGLALVNQATGRPRPTLDIPFTDPWISPRAKRSPMRVWRIDVTPDGTRLVATGNFSRAAGLPRDQIAMIDTTTMTVEPWSTSFFRFTDPANPDPERNSWCASIFPHYIRDIDISPDGTYLVIGTTGANNPLHPSCDSLTRWDLTFDTSGPDQEPDWVTNSGGDSYHSILATGTAVYAGGHQQWANNPYNPRRCGFCDGPYPGGVVRTGFSAHDPSNGLPFTWNPVRQPRGKGVLAMVSTSNGFFFGSDTDRINGEVHRRNGFMPLDGGITIPADVEYTLTDGDFYTGTASNLLVSDSDGTTFGPGAIVAGVDWSNVRAAAMLNGTLYTAMANGTLVRRTFNGTEAGPATVVDLNGLELPIDPIYLIPGTTDPIPALSAHLAQATGMFFENGFMYYTVENDARLYSRGFTQESQMVGAPLTVASTGDGVDWANVRGMTLASGQLYFALADGSLNSIGWSSDAFGQGHPTGGSATTIAGSGWVSNGMFVF